MNQSEHKAEAERLIDVAHTQLELIQSNLKHGVFKSNEDYITHMATPNLTALMAQTHATLATIPD